MINKLTAISILILTVIGNLTAQQKQFPKIELENQHFKIYKKYGVSNGITTYLKIDGQAQEQLFDPIILNRAFKDCAPAYKFTLQSLEHAKEAKKYGKRAKIGTGIIVGSIVGGLYLWVKNEDAVGSTLLFAGGGGTGFLISNYFNRKSGKASAKAYLDLVSAVDAYEAECYDSSLDNQRTEEESANVDVATTYEIDAGNLREKGYTSFDVNLFDGRIGISNKQIGSGLRFSTFKNGYYLGASISKPIFDGQRLAWNNEFDIDRSVFSKAVPINAGGALTAEVLGIFPISSKIKVKKVSTNLGQSRGINMLQRGEVDVLYSWGVRAGVEFDRAVYERGLLSSVRGPIEFENDLGATVTDAIFFQSATNVKLGLTRTMYTAYSFKTNDKRFDTKRSTRSMVFNLYANAIYNVATSFGDMQIEQVTSQNRAITFIDVPVDKMGFEAGLDFVTSKGRNGFNMGLRGGLQPAIQGYRSAFLGLRMGYTFMRIVS